MSTRDLILLAVLVEVPLCVGVVVWVERLRRESARRRRDLHRRLSWYIHGRGL